jgi:hypothetical protein
MIKSILNQRVDVVFGLIALVLFVWYLLDQTKNFTGFLLLVVGYVINNIVNKALIIKNTKI